MSQHLSRRGFAGATILYMTHSPSTLRGCRRRVTERQGEVRVTAIDAGHEIGHVEPRIACRVREGNDD
ncbi:hypothetical protein [Cellulomonas dongxiuzhuiae]|uniref:Uncharacterized protein n=1 Tax=Cellulomonas dongxiuzhuiae TaxID=2819979 RepID=A0ABX8GGC3_9CELL|nr:hypothetical protein [Cellulomonas dongxiuzhuiae]MBO3093576.1 hypothetical protein [Cellulomonas dongxiuzhuiae]QWC14701.1 hypothetical protein KKR89_09955 [Cellulomonas dongxiuzhuiae]